MTLDFKQVARELAALAYTNPLNLVEQQIAKSMRNAYCAGLEWAINAMHPELRSMASLTALANELRNEIDRIKEGKEQSRN